MKNQQPTNSNILDPKCGPLGFIVGDWDDINSFYAAVPCGKGLMVIHQGKQLKKCRNTISARNFIEKYRKTLGKPTKIKRNLTKTKES